VYNKGRAASLLAVLLMAAPAFSAVPSTYVNSNWGFSVLVPSGMSYETSPAPNPNHGFKIPISKESFVWVNADSSDDQSLAAAVDTELRLWVEQGCATIQKSRTSLGAKPAEKIVLKCPAGLDRAELKRVSLIVALESPPGINNTAYTIGVTYAESGQAKGWATAAFNAVRHGFRFATSQ
jgi:hypothetical protein